MHRKRQQSHSIGEKAIEFDTLTHRVIGCAIEVHRHLGPGLLESAYESCLSYELRRCEIAHQTQVPLTIHYKGTQIDCGYRIDILVGKSLILELKSVDQLHRIHEAQILTYMKLAGAKTGLLINFNVTKLKDRLKRFVL